MWIFKPNVEKLEAKKDIAGLIKALDYEKDTFVQKKAAEALGKIGDARAVEPLIKALMREDEKGIKYDQNWKYVRLEAAEALGKIGDARAVNPLIQALESLGFWDILKKVRTALVRIGEPAVEPLIQALKRGDMFLKQTVSLILGTIGDRRAVEPLIQVIGKTHKWGAVKALGKIGDRRAVKPIILLLKEGHIDSYGWDDATEALEKIGDPVATPLIVANAHVYGDDWDAWNRETKRALEKVLEEIEAQS